MAETPEQAIRLAAQAYVEGNGEALLEQLHDQVRLHGSHRRDNWRSKEEVQQGLEPELRHHSVSVTPTGTLVDHALNAQVTWEETDPIVWWTGRGDLTIGADVIDDASWTVIVGCRGDKDWRIVHSHFSIHR